MKYYLIQFFLKVYYKGFNKIYFTFIIDLNKYLLLEQILLLDHVTTYKLSSNVISKYKYRYSSS